MNLQIELKNVGEELDLVKNEMDARKPSFPSQGIMGWIGALCLGEPQYSRVWKTLVKCNLVRYSAV